MNARHEPGFVHENRELLTDDGQRLVMTHVMNTSTHGEPGVPVVLVHGLGQNRYSWHTSRLSFAEYLAGNGMDVYIPELRGHGLSRAFGSEYPAGFCEYVLQDVPAVLKEVSRLSGGRKVFYCGHSLGGTIGLALEPREQSLVRGMILFGAPFHFGKGLPVLRTASWLLMVAYKNTPLKLIDLLDKRMSFNVNLFGKAMMLTLFIHDSTLNPLPYRLWYPGSFDRDVLEERLLQGFDKTGFEVVKDMVAWAAKGKLWDRDVDYRFEKNVSDNKVPVLFVIGDEDNVVPPESVLPAYRKIGSADKTWKVLGGRERIHWGHLDMILGREAPKEVWPYVYKWMADRM